MSKKYSEEYKQDAVKLVIENKQKAATISKDLGIGKSTLDKWIRIYKLSTTTTDQTVNEREEVRQLKAENQKLRLERDLLKRATIFFANDQLN